ncbi:MAG TPA: serine/threonine protein kinase, partial [bacterium]|nr:serine/threonine protein kinase [bacterium]
MSGDTDFGQARDFYTFAPETLARDLPAFEVLRCLGQGSMGIVYEARQRDTGALVALKLLPPSLTLTERALARFLREGRIMARVRHPDIVAFLDQGRNGRLYWFAMEFVQGATLEQRLRVGPLPVVSACRIAARVGRALQYAHDHGVVHRDIKPGNLMLRDPQPDAEGDDVRVAITDFGLARETGTGSMTESGAIVGTPMYMAPEVVLGGTDAANTLADVYSLGATLYTLVTGRPPFEGPTAQGVLKAVTERRPTPARQLRRDLPDAVDAIIAKAMARDPAERYGSALELAEDLERFLAGERVLARRPSWLWRGVRWCRERPLISALGASVLVLAIGAGILAYDRHVTEVQRQLADAERLLALASTSHDDQDRPRSAGERRDLLLGAIAAASRAIARDDNVPAAWLVRARAHLRLQHHTEAIFDLDVAERLRGAASPEILHFRIDALRHLGDDASQRRLQMDLTELLTLDPSPATRALVAELLLDFAAQADGHERAAALGRVEEILAPVDRGHARSAVARARRLELLGDIPAALAAMRQALVEHDGNLYVHLQAAAMFDRNDLPGESEREQAMARRMQSNGVGTKQPAPPPVDLRGLDDFLGEVDRVLQVL